MLKNTLTFFEQIGRSLILPLAILPLAAILMSMGSYDFAWMPVLASKCMLAAGNIVFSNLPLIFAVSIAVGFSENDGLAGLSAMVAYLLMLAGMSVVLPLAPVPPGEPLGVEFKTVLGFEVMDTGVFGGVLVGGVTAWAYRRFKWAKLPAFLDFLSGRRFVAIFCALVSFGIGAGFGYIWPAVQGEVAAFAVRVASADPVTAGTAYGLAERLLMPFGLNHSWTAPFLFEAGRYVSPDTGVVAHGELSRFFAGDPEAGILSGGFLITIWGIPAAALAVWRSARRGKRSMVGGVMLLAALTSILTGITEPVEYAFMFAAPVLYLLHALLAGAGYAIMNILDVHIGYGMAQGAIDLAAYYSMASKPWLLFVAGPVYALVYYALFRAMIHLLGFRTFGREDIGHEHGQVPAHIRQARELVVSLGGKENIIGFNARAARLRVSVADYALVDSGRIMGMGAAAVEEAANVVQIVFGVATPKIKQSLDEYLSYPGDIDELVEELGLGAELDEPALRREGAHDAPPEEVERLREFLGGGENILSAEPVAKTRLLVRLKDKALMRAQEARDAGILLFVPDHGDAVQVLVGAHPERYGKLV